jgi:hypothetical protein
MNYKDHHIVVLLDAVLTPKLIYKNNGSASDPLSGFGIDEKGHARTAGIAGGDQKDSHQQDVCPFH